MLVFQIVSYTNKFKCPIAYFFINKINASLQAQLIKCAIEKLYEVGVIVRSLTNVMGQKQIFQRLHYLAAIYLLII